MINVRNEKGQEIILNPITIDAVEETLDESLSVVVIGTVRIVIQMAAGELYRLLVESLGGRFGKGLEVKKHGRRVIAYRPFVDAPPVDGVGTGDGLDGETGLSSIESDSADEDDPGNPSQESV